MNNGSPIDQAREIVKRFYDGGARREITSFRDSLAEDFELFVPPSFPGAAPSTRISMWRCCPLGCQRRSVYRALDQRPGGSEISRRKSLRKTVVDFRD